MPAPRGAPDRQGSCVLLKHGEIFLKGRNRHLFTERLHDNLRLALRGIGGSTWIKTAQNVTVLGGQVPQEALLERARRVIGFNSVEPAVRVPSELEAITAAAVDALADVPHRATFSVRTRRRDKQFPLTSSQVDAHVGARVLARVPGLRVNLARPDVVLAVEIDRKETYVSRARLPGLTGLPVGSSGRALVLLSGGYDSPVAAHRAMRRGLACDFVHFNGGTAGISVLPDEDCCSLLAPPRVSTRAGLPQLHSVERRLDLDEVVETLLDAAQVLRPGADTEEVPAASDDSCAASV
ncbi:THUMP domain-containing protein [Streptomyces sp. NPDC053750]|uniref:THUMP domain-containing protein n=1 Tax=Streptomyces sp. NPDC053750 TaxID=3365714 RepID=UPI0037CF8FDE